MYVSVYIYIYIYVYTYIMYILIIPNYPYLFISVPKLIYLHKVYN